MMKSQPGLRSRPRAVAGRRAGTLQGRCRSVAKRNNPYSRWRRLPPVFRSGEHKLPTPGDEPQRIIVYLRGDILDRAEALAAQAGVPTVQEYCAGLLARAIETERVKHQVAEVEAKRGPLEGFHEIADDPDYLAEWRGKTGARENPPPADMAPGTEHRLILKDDGPVEVQAHPTSSLADGASAELEPAP